MNLLDVVLAVLALFALSAGLRLGLLARVSTWIGLLVGLAASTLAVPAVLERVETPGAGTRLLLALAVLVVTVSVGSRIGGAIGQRLRSAVSDTVLGGPDRVAGGLAGLAGLVVLTWLVAPAAADVPGGVARQVRESTVVATVADTLPPAPAVVDTLAQAVSRVPFPDVLGPLQPAPALGPPPSQLPVTQSVLATVTRSTVNVEGRGCGLVLGEGSGWVVAPGLVVTNAHVVEQLREVSIRRDDGATRPASVVARDDQRDLALLAVDDLDRPPLARSTPGEGDEVVIAGHPGGQDQVRVAPGRIDRVQSTVGRTTDGRSARRDVVFLAASLLQGDSGAPVADAEGRVVATAFAIAPDVDTTAYAVSDSELDAVLDAPRGDVTGPDCGS